MIENLRADLLQEAVVNKFSIDLDVVVHETVDSTNTWSLQQCKQGRALPFACFAEEQTAGKGRRGKSWLMSPQSNIAMSLCWPFALSNQQLLLLPLSIALAIVKTLEKVNLKQVQIKWPNDVYVQGKKIAGILIETRRIKSELSANTNNTMAGSAVYSKGAAQNNSLMAVIIGIGLNYDMSAFDATQAGDLSASAIELTDIRRECTLQNIKNKIGRKLVATTLLQNVVDICQHFQKCSLQNLEVFRENYDYCNSKTVEILLDNQQTLSGIAKGVNDRAELLVMIDGKQRAFNSAEVSVKEKTL